MLTGAEHVETIVIGGGQAGLSVGYHLKRRGLPFLILDANDRIGHAWRTRWDSLRLFTPARFSGLDGMPFPGDRHHFPSKDEMADYLEAYAARFDLPVRSGTRVSRLSHAGGRFIVQAEGRRLEADQVVVAMSDFQKPRVPAFAQALDPGITQLHSIDYRKPAQLQSGDVLIVGAGNSGAEIALDVSKEHRVWISGRKVGHIPFRIEGRVGRLLLVRLVLRVLFHRVLSVSNPIGRKARPAFVSKGGPLVRTRPKELAAAGVTRVPRTQGAHDGLPQLEDGRTLDVRNVIWCTGFGPGFPEWINLHVLDGEHPVHESGIVPGRAGLYFAGLLFLHSVSSEMIHGVGRDAERIVRAVEARRAELLEIQAA
ncbi:MAG: NAD(P)/FAD-dependent oxidoreductase [Gemmatimonadota bacterium]